jgi:hypothetical protein
VGYNEDGLLIKNSWGPDWGKNGFITLKHGNTCGVYNEMVVVTE